jgi:hypothetical protein
VLALLIVLERPAQKPLRAPACDSRAEALYLSGRVTWFTFAARWVSYQCQTSLILEVGIWRSQMATTIAWFLPRASATSVASIESFITVALFSGIGLLLSLSVLILDQYIPGEWF